jgi:hypothetical protein
LWFRPNSSSKAAIFSIPVSSINRLASGEICGREEANAILVKPIMTDDRAIAVRGIELIIK